MVNFLTKCEVFVCTGNKDMKTYKLGWFGVLIGHSRSLEITPFDSEQTILN